MSEHNTMLERKVNEPRFATILKEVLEQASVPMNRVASMHEVLVTLEHLEKLGARILDAGQIEQVKHLIDQSDRQLERIAALESRLRAAEVEGFSPPPSLSMDPPGVE